VCKTRGSDSQVSDLEAGGEAVAPELGDVVVAQVQGLHGRQLSGPPAVDTADLIVMPGERRENKNKHITIKEEVCRCDCTVEAL